MPFLPFVLLLAWQALSRGASFALGWATALYFGQVPGSKGRILAVSSLAAAAWVIVIVGFALPLSAGAIGEALGLIGRNFEVDAWMVAGLWAAIVLTPPAIAACIVFAEFSEERSMGRWVRMIPVAYPATASLGLAVLLMVVITPVLAFLRLRRKEKLLQVPVVMRPGTDDDDLADAIAAALRQLDIAEVKRTPVSGARAWPMWTAGFAAEHLLGATVRGEPMRLRAGELDVYAYATNIAVHGPGKRAYKARAALERELAFRDAYLTWSPESQGLEDELMRARAEANGDRASLVERLDRIQARIDSASLNAEEWNVLYRLRLQVEHRAERETKTRA